MLRKLMKHEFRATGRIMLPLFLLVLALGLGSNGAARLLTASHLAVLRMLGGLVLFAFVLAVVALSVVALVLMINRFRTNLMSDEGYIMFTLPVSVHQLVWSKLLVSTVWLIGTVVVDCLAALLASFRVAEAGEFFAAMAEGFRMLNAKLALNGAAVAVETIALCVVACLTCCLVFYAAMAVGHSFAGHKTLLSVVFFFVFYFAVQLVCGIGLLGLNFVDIPDLMEASVHAVMWSTVLGVAVVGAVFYFLTTFMLKRKLNLE